MKRYRHHGFTLIELLVVIAIIAVILGLTTANLLGARGRARDAKNKAEMKELKNALRLYYNDYQSYPAAGGAGTPFNGCGVGGTSACPNGVGCPEFGAWTAAGTCTDANATSYMKRLPRSIDGTNFSFTYTPNASRDDFCLAVPLENAADTEIAVSQTRCSSVCAGHCDAGSLNYCMCAD